MIHILKKYRYEKILKFVGFYYFVKQGSKLMNDSTNWKNGSLLFNTQFNQENNSLVERKQHHTSKGSKDEQKICSKKMCASKKNHEFNHLNQNENMENQKNAKIILQLAPKKNEVEAAFLGMLIDMRIYYDAKCQNKISNIQNKKQKEKLQKIQNLFVTSVALEVTNEMMAPAIYIYFGGLSFSLSLQKRCEETFEEFLSTTWSNGNQEQILNQWRSGYKKKYIDISNALQKDYTSIFDSLIANLYSNIKDGRRALEKRFLILDDREEKQIKSSIPYDPSYEYEQALKFLGFNFFIIQLHKCLLDF